jgi:hypothetical protein
MSLLSLSGLLVQSLRLSHLLAVLCVLLLAACEKVPLTSPTGSTITLTVDKTAVPIGGTATLTAVVSEASGTAPQNGTMVTFNAAFGTITPQEAPTVGGVARATFTATASGTAKVGAFSGPAKATEVELKVGGAAVERITLRSDPSTLSANGGTVTVIASVQDASGGILPNTPVNFTTDNGSLSSNSANTDASGEARVQLTTTRTAKVTAAVGTKTADFTITTIPAPNVVVTCSAGPIVGVAVTCTVTATVQTGGAPLTGATINWGDSTAEQSLGSIGSGNATSASHVYTRGGTYTVTATATDASGQRGTASTALNVNRSLPTVGFTCPTGTQTVGVAGTFTVTPPSNPPVPIANITVDFGDGTSRSLGTPTGTTSFAKAYGSEGAFTATATITDTAGQTGSSSCVTTVGTRVSPNAPTVTLTFSAPVEAGVPETFTVTGTPASGGAAISSNQVRLSDGTLMYSGPNGQFAYTFPASGTYTVIATTTDASGASGSTQTVVTVGSRAAPTVTLTYTAPVDAGVSETFTVTGTPVSGGPAISNNVVRLSNGTQLYSGPNGQFAHTFAAAGTYTLIATTTDASGATGTTQVVVTVGTPTAPTVTLTFSAPVVNGTPETFTVTGSPGSGGATISNNVVRLADNTLMYSGPNGTFSWTFPAAGSYTVTATTTDSSGATGSTQIVVTVQ